MKIHNFLPVLIECLKRWEKLPKETDFAENYYKPLAPFVNRILFDESKLHPGREFYECLKDINWAEYRRQAIQLSPEGEEKRTRRHLKAVEDLFGFALEGEVILLGAFTSMDGYARFDRGTHRVFLGVDESHARGRYLDILMTHELTHVARESRASVWEGLGLNPKMTHDEFTENMPVLEHLMSEGFSCVVSEILVPGQDPWLYAYLERDEFLRVLEHGPAVDRVIHEELSQADGGDYGTLYSPSSYRPQLPTFTHYVWAWQWVKALLRDVAQGDPRKLVGASVKDFADHAKKFQLKSF